MLKLTIQEFINKTFNDKHEIPNMLKQMIEKELSPNESVDKEYQSWVNSYSALAFTLNACSIPRDIEIILECELYATPFRTDVILAGKKDGQDKLLIIELKQWESPFIEKKDNTHVLAYNEIREHPMYQVNEYRNFIETMYTNVRACNINVEACAYMHNYIRLDNDPLWDNGYTAHNIDLLFHKNTQKEFQTFLEDCFDSSSATVVENVFEGPKQLSPDFLDNIARIIEGQPVFTPKGEQIKVLDNILINLSCNENQHHIFVVKGGPGTGKTVLAFNLLAKLASNAELGGKGWRQVRYTTKNKQLINTYTNTLKEAENEEQEKKLPAYNNRTIGALISSLNNVIDDNTTKFDCLIIDESQRLPDFQEPIKKDVIKRLADKAKNIIFLLDDCQKLAFNDLDFTKQINDLRKDKRYKVFPDVSNQSDYTLYKAFRTFGSKAHLDWIDHFLGYEHMKQTPGQLAKDYDIKVVSTPEELFEMVRTKVAAHEHARVLAGLCWHWHKDRTKTDISIDENGVSYRYPWNNDQSYSWATDPETVNEVGCVHTVLGQEFDYTGVIIGDDLTFDGKEVVPNPDVNTQFMRYKKTENDFPRENGRKLTDEEIETVIKLSKNKDSYRFEEAKEIVRNHYHVLLTRGRKGCYIYCVDPALRQYLKSLLEQPVQGKIIGNKYCKYYHIDPKCTYCPGESKRVYFQTIADAEACNYKPCSVCCKEKTK